MNRALLLVGLVQFFFICTQAQDINNFKPLYSVGEIPIEINKSSASKIKEQTSEISKNQTTSEINTEKDFILKSNYILDRILSNGVVFYGNKINKYVEKVADELLKDNLTLRKELSFYIVKTSEINAFATDRGEIFITIGLLAQIENEAQLAFVLSHEIIHYKNKHAKTGFIENDKIDNSKDKYKKTNWDKLFSKSKYSKELEMEADMDGLEIYLKSNYSLKEINAFFYVFQYSHLPIDDVVFEKDYFDDENWSIQSILANREVAQIEAIDDEEDEYQDHPNINKRRAIIHSIIENESNEGRVNYIISKDGFIEVQSLARLELSYLFTKSRHYGEAIYNSYIMLKRYPDNKFLKLNLGYCLYALSKYKNGTNLNDVLTDFNNVQGESQNVFYLFNEIDKRDLSVLAVKYLWGLKAEITDDKFLNVIAEDAIKEMLLNSGVRKSELSKKVKVEIENTVIDSSKLSKYDKIKNKQKEEGTSYEYAFVNLFNNKEFEGMINQYEKVYVDKVIKNEDNNRFENDKKTKQALGLKEVVLVSPNYRHFKTKKEISEDYVYADVREKQFINSNKQIAKSKNVNLEVINYREFRSTDEYNDLGLLSDWMEERYGHFNLEVYPYCSMFTDDLIDKYGTKYFAWSGIYSFHVGKKGLGWAITGSYFGGMAFGAASLTLLPLGAAIPIILYIANSSNRSFYYTYLFDISNYKAHLINESFKSGIPMTGYVSDTFRQISTKPKN
tara:strand:+ start:116387 stop:118582 length:2196 start_codon:yes stop_codon:yes gene_type:complete